MVIRRNVAELTARDRRDFVNAVKGLKKAPSRFTPPTTSRYDDYVYIHLQSMMKLKVLDPSAPVVTANLAAVSSRSSRQGAAMPMAMPDATNAASAPKKVNGARTLMWGHQCPAFLPWHRELLHQFELDLQRVSGDNRMAIPYWDWTKEKDPSETPWLPDLMGGDGEKLSQKVNIGPFAGSRKWRLNLNLDGNGSPIETNYLTRQFARRKNYTLPRRAEVSSCVQNTVYDMPPWNSEKSNDTGFRIQLEGLYDPPNRRTFGLHDLVHVWVGGTMASISGSPNDPVFFLHHSNVDRIWARWMCANPAVPFYLPERPIRQPGNPDKHWAGQALDEPLIFFDRGLSSTRPWGGRPATPRSVLDHRALGYTYDRYGDR